MLLMNWLSSLQTRRRFHSHISRRRRSYFCGRRARKEFGAAAELLEDRTLLSVFSVNSVADTVDVNPGDGVAADSSGNTTLRAAIMEANALPGHDSITFDSDLNGTEILLEEGSTYELDGWWGTTLPPVCSDLTLAGNGANRTVIRMQCDDWEGYSEVFSVQNGANFELNSLGITGGCGPAIANHGGSVTLANCEFAERSSMWGVVENWGNDSVMTINACVFRDHVGWNSGGNGPICNGSGATLTVRDTTITACSAADAGAIWNAGIMTISNTTLSNNSSWCTGGGGILNRDGGTMTISNTTISNNADTSYGNAGGGGIFNENGGTVNMVNTIVANNSAGSGPDIYGTVNSLDYNLIEDTTGATITGTTTHNITGVDPRLGALSYNGGPTQTHALLWGSPAIDAGNNGNAPSTDQRGVSRPRDGDGDGIATADIGAYERLSPGLDVPEMPAFQWFEVNGERTDSTTGTFTVLGGQEFWIKADFENSNWDNDRAGGITMSFPGFTGQYLGESWESYEGDTQGARYSLHKAPGDSIWTVDGTQTPAVSHMVEGGDGHWESYSVFDLFHPYGEDNILSAQLCAPSQAGTFYVDVRAWMIDDTADTQAEWDNADWTIVGANPTDGTSFDQQGYPTYRFTINVVQPKPDLKPHQLDNWSDRIVVSTNAGDNSDDSTIFSDENIYIDWAVINGGDVATASDYYTALYLDGSYQTRWNNSSPHSVGTCKYVVDYCLGTLLAGNHTIEIRADYTDVIDEKNDDVSDNNYSRDITVYDRPDLIVESVGETDQSYQNGEKINARTWIKNDGGDTAGSSHIRYYLGTADGADKTYRDIIEAFSDGFSDIGSLSPGEHEDDIINLGWTIPDDVEAGSYRVWVLADSEDDVWEGTAGENNNWGSSEPFTIGPEPEITAIRWENAAGSELADGTTLRTDSSVWIEVDTLGLRGQDVDVYLWEEDDTAVIDLAGDDLIKSITVHIPSDSDTGRVLWPVEWHTDYDGDTRAPEFRLWDNDSFFSSGVHSRLLNVDPSYDPDFEPGVTIITHGWQLTGQEGSVPPEWAIEMAEAILLRADAAKGDTKPSVFVHDPGADTPIWVTPNERGIEDDWWTNNTAWVNGNSLDDEIVLIYDWSWESNDVDSGWVEAAADALFAALAAPFSLGGTSVDLLTRPLHFIGHSRGAVLNSLVTELMAHYYPGEDIEHVTTLDPHPALLGDYDDPEIFTYDTVVCADNYYRQDGLYELDLDFNGVPVEGAWNLELNESVLNNSLTGYDFEHWDVHLWYTATIKPEESEVEGYQIDADYEDWWKAGTAYNASVEPKSYEGNVGYARSRIGGRSQDMFRDIEGKQSPTLLTPQFFNGDFELLGGDDDQIPGWERHGGGGGNPEVPDFDRHLVLDSGDDLRHNWQFVPPSAASIEFDLSIDRTSSSDILGVYWWPEGGSEQLLGAFSIASAAFEGSNKRVALPDGAGEQVGRVRLALEGTGSGRVFVDDIEWSTVTAVNNPPVLVTNTGIAVDQDASEVVNTSELRVTDADVPAQTLTYTIVTNVSHGSLSKSGAPLGASSTFTQSDIDAGNVSYTHDGSETANDSFVFTVSDGNGGTIGNTTFTITVTDVDNFDPEFSAADYPATVAEDIGDTVKIATVSATEDDLTGTVSYAITGGNDSGLFEIHGTTGAVSLAAGKSLDAETTTSHVLTVTASESDGSGTDTATVTITVTDVDEFDPEFSAADYPATVAEDIGDTVTIATVSATEADLTGSVTYAITGGNDAGLFEINGTTGVVSLASGKSLNAESATSHVLTVTASESDGSGTDTATVTITVTDVVTDRKDTIGLYDPSSSAFHLKNTNQGGAADLSFGFGPGDSHWRPLAGDWDGDGVDTVGLYDSATGTFYLKDTNEAGIADVVFGFGPANSTWTALAGDWDGDGRDTVGLYDSATGTFYLKDTNEAGIADVVFGFGPANSTWTALAGDWDGDGVDSIGLCDSASGTFYLRNANSAGIGDVVFNFGPDGANWKPLAGDWNQDGTATVGLYDSSGGSLYLRNTNVDGVADVVFDYGPASANWVPLAGDWNGPSGGTDTVGLCDSSLGTFYLKDTTSGGVADSVFGFGPGGWTPLVGDWDGDGTDTVGLYRPDLGMFYLKNTHAGGTADIQFGFGPGSSDWTPLVGDWDGDGTDTVGLYRPDLGMFYLKNTHAGGTADVQFSFGPGSSDWTPLVGDWNGDGTDTVGLYRPDLSTFYLKNTHAGGTADVQFSFGPGSSDWTPLGGDWNDDGTDTVGLYRPDLGMFYLKNTHAGGTADVQFGFGPGNSTWTPLVGDWDGGSASSALQLDAPALVAGPAPEDLTADTLAPVLEAAINLWAGTGISASELSHLESVTVSIADLSGSTLALTTSGNIVIDVNAAGYGWYMEGLNSEFGIQNPEVAATRVDLLTVVAHEFGHVLGLGHDASDDVMEPLLELGVRRLPGPEDIDAAFASDWDDYLVE